MDLVKTLASLADLTWHLGCLHELQIRQLQMWPLAILGVESSESVYDHDGRIITVNLGPFGDDVLSREQVEERIQFLGDSIQMMLGGDVCVQIIEQSGLNTTVWPQKILQKPKTPATKSG